MLLMLLIGVKIVQMSILLSVILTAIKEEF